MSWGVIVGAKDYRFPGGHGRNVRVSFGRVRRIFVACLDGVFYGRIFKIGCRGSSNW